VRRAIAHEWLSSRAGSEKTFEAMAAVFPDADLFALSREPGVPFDFGGRDVRTTILDRTDFLRRRRDVTLPLMPLAWRLLRTPEGGYDQVLTSSHACVKAFPPARAAEHFCYVHAPMRYAWDRGIDSRASGGGRLMSSALDALRRWDVRSTRTVDHFAANSTAVRERINRFYGRDARVIHPPVDTRFYTVNGGDRPRRGALAVSRFIPYKGLQLAIEACANAEMPLTIAGSGPMEAELRRRAAGSGNPVVFEIGPSDERLRELYRTSEVLLFPAEEDFGIVPVEAQACGTPVVGIASGGTLDTVVHERTGILVGSPDPGLLAEALRALPSAALDAGDCRANAERFARERFERELRAWLGSTR
jgi:glycosyltransferase involved in cell wall biosynthesis